MQTIGRYHVLRQIGQGGMAAVYLGRAPNTDQLVAIKVLSPLVADDEQFRLRFQREAELVGSLRPEALDPGTPIVPLLDHGEDAGRPYLVMGYLAGGTLAHVIAQGPLPPRALGPIVERLAVALRAAHRRGIIHRDLKPSNVLFDDHGHAYLSDFGIAKILLDAQRTSLTGTRLIGTPAYMSPEQAGVGGAVTNRTDIYALGVVVYEMLTGRRPYRGDTPVQILLQHINVPVPVIEPQAAPTLEHLPWWNAILARALAKDPAERYPSAMDLAADVGHLARGTLTRLSMWSPGGVNTVQVTSYGAGGPSTVFDSDATAYVPAGGSPVPDPPSAPLLPARRRGRLARPVWLGLLALPLVLLPVLLLAWGAVRADVLGALLRGRREVPPPAGTMAAGDPGGTQTPNGANGLGLGDSDAIQAEAPATATTPAPTASPRAVTVTLVPPTGGATRTPASTHPPAATATLTQPLPTTMPSATSTVPAGGDVVVAPPDTATNPPPPDTPSPTATYSETPLPTPSDTETPSPTSTDTQIAPPTETETPPPPPTDTVPASTLIVLTLVLPPAP